MPDMKVPGPDHPITITANPQRLQALFESHVIADSETTLTLQEAGYKAVAYFPRDDVAMAYLSRTDRTTYCPYKGEAHYYTIVMEGRIVENAVWTYEDPYPAVAAIKGRLAFYPQHVNVQPLEDDEAADRIRETILHTDDGAGRSQRDHWPPNVDTP